MQNDEVPADVTCGPFIHHSSFIIPRHGKRKARDSNPQAARAATCFRDRFLIRPDAFRCICMSSGGWNRTRAPTRSVGPPGSEPGVTTSSNYPGSLRHTISKKARGEGIEPPFPGSKPGGLPLADPRSRKSATTTAAVPGGDKVRGCGGRLPLHHGR